MKKKVKITDSGKGQGSSSDKVSCNPRKLSKSLTASGVGLAITIIGRSLDAALQLPFCNLCISIIYKGSARKKNPKPLI